MNLLILGDIMGASGRKALSNKLPDLIKTYKIDFVIVNGENASPLFVKLTEAAGREIQWNFTKFLINKEGEFVRGFGTQKKPEEIEEHIKAII